MLICITLFFITYSFINLQNLYKVSKQSIVTLIPTAALFYNINIIYQHNGLFFMKDYGLLYFIASLLLALIVFSAILLHKNVNKINTITLAIVFLVTVALFLLNSQNIVEMVFFFEFLLLTAVFSLNYVAKNERALEAMYEMLMWTLFGSLFLFYACFVLIQNPEVNYLNNSLLLGNSVDALVVILLIGFSVKLPLWPFHSWLLKAHVEASTEFSILLSGFIVKLGLFCFYIILSIYNSFIAQTYILITTSISLIFIPLKIMEQVDLKKIVALTTILEINWIIFLLILNTSITNDLWKYLLVVHTVATTCEFMVVEYIYTTFKTRNIFKISGLYQTNQSLWYLSFLTVCVTIGLPGTIIFFLKFIFFYELASISLMLFCAWLIILFTALPVIFFKIWVPIWFGSNNSIKFTNSNYLRKDIIILFTILLTLNVVSYLFL